jgi:two-component system, cell cycle sensor histidine kinase and response regulator CckA
VDESSWKDNLQKGTSLHFRQGERGKRQELSTARRDFLVIAAVACAVLLLSLLFDGGELIQEWMRKHEDWELDELLIIPEVLLIGFTIFTIRRWRELRTEVIRRQQVEKELLDATSELETKVENRTAELRASNERLHRELEERQRVEEHLSESEERYRQIIEHANDIIYRTDARGRFVFVNPTVAKIMRRPAEEFLGTNYLELVRPDSRQAAEAFYRQQFTERIPDTYYEFPAITQDGGEVWFGQNVQLITKGDRIEGFQAVARDITERKRAEEAMRSAKEYRDLFKLANDAILIFEPEEEKVLDVNDKACEIYGLARESFIGRSLKEFSLDTHRGEQHLKKLLADGTYQEFETVQRQADGTPINFLINASVIEYQGRPAILSINRDITARKHAAEQVHLLAHAVESTSELISITDFEDRFTFVNKAFVDAYGYDLEEIIGQTPAMLDSPNNSPDIRHEIAEQTCRGGWSGVLLNRRKDGSEFPLSLSTSVIRDSQKKVVGLLGIGSDVTERQRAETEIRRMASILEATTDFVGFSDAQGVMLYVNQAGREMLGVGEEEVTGMRVSDLYTPQMYELVSREAIPAAIRDGAWSGETLLLSREGRETPVSQVILSHKKPTGEVEFLSTIARDITESKLAEERLRQSEEQLWQAQKMDSIGTLTGGIAHDFNNLLTAINGYSELTLKRAELDDRVRRNIEEIKKAGDRSAMLTRQLLAFSRRQRLERKHLNLNDLIGDLMKMMQRIIGEDVEIHWRATSNLSSVFADSGQIEQVVMNLAVNARDAMPGGGLLTIETHNIELDESYCHIRPYTQPGKYAQLIVSDTGMGMDAAIRERIFEPFFTTKEVGKGTGLGLSTVYGIIKQHDGCIEVTSEIGQGTTFTIYLPVNEEVEEEEAQDVLPLLKGRGETILVAEDEEALQVLARAMLEDLGYEVLLASDGQEAIEVYRAHRENIDLLLLDMVMPRTGGFEAYEQIRTLRPDMPVVFMTGYSLELVQDRFVKHSKAVEEIGAVVIQKPYSLDVLGRTVREALKGAVNGVVLQESS